MKGSKLFKKNRARFFKWARSFIGSQNRVCRVLSIPLAIYLLSEFKLEIFARADTASRVSKKQKSSSRKKKILSYRDIRFKYEVFRIIFGAPYTESNFLKILDGVDPRNKAEYIHIFMDNGFLDLAKLTGLDVINRHISTISEKQQFDIYSLLAVISFLEGHNKEACQCWEEAGKIKRIWEFPSTPRTYRIIGPDWFCAIGHIAMLDFYFKHKKLYGSSPCRIVMENGRGDHHLIKILSRKFSELGLVALNQGEIEEDFNKWQATKERVFWNQLDDNEKKSLVDDFWLYEFPDDKILGYAHGASKIQKDWERANYSPLLQVSLEELKWLNEYKDKIGLPRNAWYVCLHVREGGFHQSWNKLYPTIRDAKVESYYKAIEEITNAGGWVIRMGDSSMHPLPDMPNVIDYANSLFCNSYADLLFPATCKFFIGTNSGYATIPAIFGTPCAFTNWVPIGWPLWPSQDLMIFKLFREKKTNRYLSLEEIFETKLAFIQNSANLPLDIEVVGNTAEEIRQLTSEMLEACVFKKISLKEAGAQESIMEAYDSLAKKHETFTGSRLGKSFVDQHPQVFNCLTSATTKELEIDARTALKNACFGPELANNANFASKPES